MRHLVLSLLLALALLGFVPARAHGDDLNYFRLYPTNAGQLLANLEANPAVRLGAFAKAGVHVVLKSPPADVALIPSLAARAERIGMRVVYGFRLMESAPPGGWADAARWQRNADYLKLLVREAGILPGDLVAFDDEAYGGSMALPSADAFRAAARPFLDAVRDTGIVPCVYPAAMGVTDAAAPYIMDAVDGRGELWTESVFSLSEQERLSPDAAARTEVRALKFERSARARWPAVVVRHGAFDHLLRGFSGPVAAAAVAELGPSWTFDNFRVDNALAGTPQWVLGTTLHSTNDVKHVWAFSALGGNAPNARGAPAMMLVKLASASLPSPQRKDVRALSGYLHPQGIVFRASDVFPSAAAAPKAEGWAVVEQVLPPTGSGGGVLFGASQSNSISWQVRLVETATASRIALQLMQPLSVVPSGEGVLVTLLRDPPRLTPLRVAVSLQSATWSALATGGALVSFTPAARVGLGAGHLWVGLGLEFSGARPAREGPPGLISRQAEVGGRPLSPAELDAVVRQAFPRSP